MTASYDDLADVYDWLVPDTLLQPEGAVAAFAQVLAAMPPGGRVLDCAAGTGQLAVGLALQGYDVVATDISAAMVERTRQLAGLRGVEFPAHVCSWENLDDLHLEPFDAVLCVGNSLTHAEGGRRRTALSSMRAQLCEGGLLAITSRNWEKVRAAGSRLEMPEAPIVRGDVAGVVVYHWTVPDRWDAVHFLDVGVALLVDSGIKSRVARLSFWPFTHSELRDDLEACGLTLTLSTFDTTVDRYLVIATAT